MKLKSMVCNMKDSDHLAVGVYDLFISALAIAAVVLITVRLVLPEESPTGQLIDYVDFGICAIFFYDEMRKIWLRNGMVREEGRLRLRGWIVQNTYY